MARSFTAASTQSLSSSSPPNPGYPFTVMGWFRPGVSDASARTIFMLEQAAGVPNRYGIFLLSLGLRMAIGDAGNAQATDSTTTCTINTWNHFAAVFTNATSRTIYLNAAGSATGTTSITPTGITNLEMGAWVGGNLYTGRLAEMAIWSAALDINSITAGKNGMNPLRIQRQSLLSYWPLYGFQSAEQDLVGAKSLTLNNTPPSADHAPVAPYSRRGWIGYVPNSVAAASALHRGFFNLAG